MKPKYARLLRLLLLAPGLAQAIPMDWHGVFGADATLLDNYRRVSRSDVGSTTNGSEEIALTNSNKSSASFQSYIFRLSPNLIVNDSATIKTEFSTAYQRGGLFGENPQKNSAGNISNTLYSYNTNSGSALQIKQAYAELYSDTATYIIGRHSYDWALGAVYNSGKNPWDRHVNTRDGITLKVKLGHFELDPYFAKIASGNSLTTSTRIKETGAGLVYDNPDRDIAFGVHYAVKKASVDATESHAVKGTTQNLGVTDTNILDIYFKKRLGNVLLEVEVPFLSGEIGHVYSNTTTAKLKSMAMLADLSYELNKRWKFSLLAGSVSGDDGGESSFEAMYLNPNFQVANLLFRYNLSAISNPGAANLFDSYMTNATFARLTASYSTDQWDWDFALVWAKANQAAEQGKAFFDHERNVQVANALTNQATDLGTELDISVSYRWNNAVKVGGNFAYLVTGEYFAFTNSTSVVNQADNSFLLQLNTSVEF